MNKLKRIAIWTLLPITLECLGLLFIDKVYLNAKTTFNPQKIDMSAKKKTNKINVKVPENAKDIAASYKGNYVSYVDGDTICVIDTSSNKKKELKIPDGGKVSVYKWLQDKDIMLIGEKFMEGGSCYFKFESYDAKKDMKKPLSDETQKNESKKELKMAFRSENYDIKDMAVSSATDVIYIWIGKDGGENRVFHINRMIEKKDEPIKSNDIKGVLAANKEDKLLYEYKMNNKIRVSGIKSFMSTGEEGSDYLLGIDGEDTICVGNGQSQKVKRIFSVNMKKGKDISKTITLPNEVNRKDVFVCRNGKVYVNNSEKSTVKEIYSNTETQYQGNIIGVYNFGIISQKDGKVIGTLFEN